MKLLVTGGAGYIGSVVAAVAAGAGHEVVVLDDLSKGHRDAIPAGVRFIEGTVREHAPGLLAEGFGAVVHLAAKSLVAESVADPLLYWRHNLGGTLALLEAMRVTGTPSVVFSSTAAVYGEPERTPITETDPPRSTSPYGASKMAADTALAEYARMHGIGAVSLRYFNVAGAHACPDGHWLGERHDPETHLIPSILAVAAGTAGPAAQVRLFGDDYPTPDGTCVRDYIHVTDLAEAHLMTLEACEPGQHQVYNLGTSTGYSNRDVLATCRQVTGHELPAEIASRRSGDPAVLVASCEKIHAERGWLPKRDLHAMVADAWSCLTGRPPGERPVPGPGR
jgi:UDP-glucose 4-epimerase